MNRLVTPSSPIKLALLGATAVLAAACGPGGGGNGGAECTANLLTGDLVITEIMGNPEGQDEGKEWFEIYNATSATIDLSGLVLLSSAEDGASEKSHAMSETIIDPGQYLVLGGVLPEFKPAYMDYGYASDLGSLRNSAGRLALKCGVTLVDEVIHGTMASGKSLGFDGTMTPDSTANDNVLNWCESANEYEAGQFGTPRGVNDACSSIAPTECNDGGTKRQVVSPAIGDLVISEVMANPNAVGDSNGEWFEVYVAKDVDLNGVNFGKTAGDPKSGIASADCIRVTAGSYLVFAIDSEMTTNGGLPKVDYIFTGFTLTNGSTASPGNLFVGVGQTTLDEVSWTGSSAGKSRSLDPGKLTPVDNDTPEYWCAPGATDIYGDGDLGTPGAENPACDIPPPPGQCFDGGTPRPVVKPVAADVTITEFMANPTGTDGDREWIEIEFKSAVDLNGLQLGKTPGSVDTTFNPADCVRVAAGTHVVFKRDGAGDDGGLPSYVSTFGFALLQSSGSLFVGMDDAVLDMTSYATSKDGQSKNLDSVGAWCDVDTAIVAMYGAGGYGTPGAANTYTCP